MRACSKFLFKSNNFLNLKRFLCTVAKCKFDVALVESTNEALEAGRYKHRHHEGRVSSGCISVPDSIVSAIVKSCKDYPLKALTTEGSKLDSIIRTRKAPLEQDELRKRINKVRQDVGQEFYSKMNVEAMTEEQTEHLSKVIDAQSMKRAKQKIYAWKPINYDEFKGLQYLLGRSATEYAVLTQIFDEIRKRVPEFKPRSFLDFGSGVGTGTWAAANLWREHIFEYVCIDASAEMNDLAELIIRGGESNRNMSLRNIFYRQFLPASQNTKYDLVLSAFSLFELPTKKTRLDVVENLWNKCDGFLVLVEHGSSAGFSLIDEARQFLTNKNDSSDCEYHIFSPCPHSHQCPRVSLADGTPCNFEVTYNQLPLGNSTEASKYLYSYVVFRKGAASAQQDKYPRIVRPTLVRSKHSICRMCTAEGDLQEVIFTASKHGKNLYRCARASKWGDQLPITIGKKAL
ncbi:methyltransferase-like protein 17, mitochondrial [Wyeomyia smithii]|uniref:methyltransferase-like protein 17, mitochondrial n=1 Tax=Wyeomyia smithii TaxID=174621 RepID=UPI002467EEAC|nr:methyltransferase-like protein 17, mitochondrial [Wyeomyia smithii]